MKEEKNKPKHFNYFNFFLILVLVVMLNSLFLPSINSRTYEEVDYSTFLTQVESGKVDEVEIAKEEEKKVRHLLHELYVYYLEHPAELSDTCRILLASAQPLERVVCDYIAGMTDQYAMEKFSTLYIPRAWQVK